MEERTFEGQWWIPGEAAGAQRGVLDFRADRFALELDRGILDRPKPIGGTTTIRYVDVSNEVIHGVAGGEEITLLGCRSTVLSHEDPFDSAETWWPSYLLVGAHLDATDRYESIRLRTEHIDEWAGTPNLDWNVQRHTGVVSEVSIGTRREVLEATELEGWGVVEVIAVPAWSVVARRAELSTEAIVRVTPPTPFDFAECIDRATLVRGLLRTCIGAPSALTEVQIVPSGGRAGVSVSYRGVAFGGKQESDVRWHNMPVARWDLPGGFGEALAAWERTMMKHDQAWYRLCATDHLHLTNTDEALVAYAKAIEALHGRDFERPAQADEEQAQRVNRALDAMPPDLVEWASHTLQANSSPPYARHRVKELVEAMGDVGMTLAGDNPDDFAARVIATRNGLTHIHSERGSKYIADDEARFQYGRALQLIGMAYLLHEIGTPLDHLLEVYQRSSSASLTISSVRQWGQRWNAVGEAES